MSNPSVITNRPIIFDIEGKVSRISSGGIIEIGTLQGVNELNLIPGANSSLFATTRDGYFSIDGYSDSSYLGLNSIVGLRLKTTTAATVAAQHRNPPIIKGIGQYYIGGTSVFRNLGRFGMLATGIDGYGEITEYSLAWSDNSNNIQWLVDNLGNVSQEGDLNFNAAFDATIQNVKRINGYIETDLNIGYTDLDKIVLTSSDTKILSDDGCAFLQVTDDGGLYLQANTSENIGISNISLDAPGYPSLVFKWDTSAQASEFDAMSFTITSSEDDGSKAPRMYFINELVYNTDLFTPDGGDITFETDLRGTSVLSSLNVSGGDIIFRTKVDTATITNGEAGKILLESQNAGLGVENYGIEIKSEGTIKNILGDVNTTSAYTSSLFTIKKEVSLDSSGVRLIGLQAENLNDIVEILIADNLDTSTPAEVGSFALDKNLGMAWIKTTTTWERLATTTSISRSESVFVNILFDVVDPPSFGDVVIIGGDYDGYGTVVPIIANYQIPKIAGVTSSETDYIQVEGSCFIKTENAILILEGEEVYLSDSEIGSITNIPPTNAGSSVVSLGLAINNSDGYFCEVLLDRGDPVFYPNYDFEILSPTDMELFSSGNAITVSGTVNEADDIINFVINYNGTDYLGTVVDTSLGTFENTEFTAVIGSETITVTITWNGDSVQKTRQIQVLGY